MKQLHVHHVILWQKITSQLLMTLNTICSTQPPKHCRTNFTSDTSWHLGPWCVYLSSAIGFPRVFGHLLPCSSKFQLKPTGYKGGDEALC